MFLDALLAHVLECEVELVSDVIAHHSAQADPAWLSEGFEPRRDINAVAEDVVFLNDHVAEIDPNAKPDALLFAHPELAVGHAALNLHGAAHGINHAWELCQEAVAGVLHSAAPVLPELRLDQFSQMRLQPFVCAFLIRPHKP
jgi:hypothetical protein